MTEKIEKKIVADLESAGPICIKLLKNPYKTMLTNTQFLKTSRWFKKNKKICRGLPKNQETCRGFPKIKKTVEVFQKIKKPVEVFQKIKKHVGV